VAELDSTKAYLYHSEAQLIAKEAEIEVLNDELAARLNEFNNLRQKGYSEQSELFRELESANIKLAEHGEEL